MSKPLGLLVLAAFLWAAPAGAQEPPNKDAIDLGQITQLISGIKPGAAAAEDKPFPDFAEVTKDMASVKGFFTLWHYPPDKKDKDKERLLCQIPAGTLGEQFMLSTSYAGGGFMTGFPLDERVVKWEVFEKQLVLVEPETRYVVDRQKEVSDAVRRTYPERIRTAVPILTKSPSGDPLIDLGPLLKSNFADILWSVSFGPLGFGGGGGSINSSLSRWTTRKAFELNVEIGVELATGRSSPPGSYDKKLVHYSFWKLPKTDYKPRIADDRVGYFLTANQDWAKPTDARDLFNRYIDRWHLVKRDSSLKLCEPRQPILFYIEKTVPVRFRRAVREGILEWNKAYEKIGFVNAVEVRQQTDDNEWKDLDPEDMRYSFFRWIVTGGGFAMGPHRANPFTGQIYDADIVFDDSMVRFFQQEAGHFIPSALAAAKMSGRGRRQFTEEILPQWLRPARDWEHEVVGGADDGALKAEVRRRLHDRGTWGCDYAQGMKHQLRLAHAILADEPAETKERVIFDAVKEVVMHEVGHTLGLRHNFKASSVYTLEEIRRRRKTGEPTVGSVMDYNPMLLLSKETTDGFFVTPTIGPYDHWAIEYGYRPSDSPPEAPKAKEGEKKEEKKDGKPETAKAEEGGEAAGSAAAEGSDLMKQVPKELLDQLPPQMKAHVEKMLASGAIQIPAGALAAAMGQGKGPGKGGPSFTGAPPGEEGMLRQIASRCNEPELAYATDEDTTFLSPDPLTNRFDVGTDPIAWAKDRIELVNQRMEKVLEWGVKEQESWYHLRGAFLSLFIEKAFVLDYVGRFIGGQYFNRSHRGDPDAKPPFVLVEPDRQRAALRFVEENLFRDQFFSVKPEVLNHLSPPRWYHLGATVTYALDFPLLEYVSTLQWWNLVDRLDPAVIHRIHDAELKTGAADRFTAAEYLQRLQKACWSDATDIDRLSKGSWTDQNPFLSTIRRSLQREYLGLVEPMVRQRPGWSLSPDLHAMFQHALQQLSADLGAALKARKMDFASEAHLGACKSRIDRMLAAELREF